MTEGPAIDKLMREAERRVRDGRTADGIEAYLAALALRSDLPDAWFNLAWLQRAERRFDEAFAAYGQAIERGVARPEEARLNRAAILSDHLFRADAAVEELEAALASNPRFTPAWLNLGAVHEDLGREAEARAAYQAALGVEPANGRAHARLGAIDVATGRAEQAIPRLKAALSDLTSVEDRAEVLFALGAALDALSDDDEAFQAFEAANWLARSTAHTRYDSRARADFVDRTIRTFARPASSAEPSDDGLRPIFICGMFRSGSTLAERLLGRHPSITAGGEFELIPALVRQLTPYPEIVPTIPVPRTKILRADYLRALAAAHTGDGLITDKRCDNVDHIGLIKALLPGVKIIHTARQPLDNILSIYFLHFGDGVPYSHDLLEITDYYIQYLRIIEHWRRLYPADIYDLDYDKTVVRPREVLTDLLSFLGLPWDDACLTADVIDEPVRTASAWQVRQPLHARSSGRWTHHADRLVAVRRVLTEAGVET